MEKNKIILKSINKKILAGTIVLGLTATTLMGCDTTTHFEYTTNEQGKYVCNNVMKYSNIQKDDYKVIRIMRGTDITIYITKKERAGYFSKGQEYFYYYDIFGTDVVYTNYSTKTTLLREENLEDYLINYDKVQEEYTEEEMQEILEQIKTDYEKSIGKTITKGM